MVPNVTKVQTSCGKFFHGQSIENIATNRFPGLRSFGHPPTPDLHCMKESRGGGGEGGRGGHRSSSSFLRCRIDHSQLGLCRFHTGAQRHGGEPGDLCAGAQLHLHVQLRTGDIFNHVLPLAIVSSPKWRFYQL